MYRKQVQSLLDFFRRNPNTKVKESKANESAADTVVNVIYTPVNNFMPQRVDEKEEVAP